MKNSMKKRALSVVLAVLMAVSGVIPAMSVMASDGVVGYYELQIFYSDTNTMVPTYSDDGETDYKEYMKEGDELQLTYKLIDSSWPDSGYVKWYSESPAVVDVDQDGLVKAFDSSKGAVVKTWINNEVKTIPIVGTVMAKVIEKALFNDYVNLDSLDTEEICDLVIAALGSDSALADYIEAYQGQLVDSLRDYLDNVNSDIHCELYDKTGTKVAEDEIHIVVEKCDEWYADFLPNGTHITNKSQIATTQATGNKVQLTAITTPQRLGFGTVYSVKSSSIFSTGKVVATVDDSGLVKFKNTGTVTIIASPDSEDVINSILKFVNYFYTLENTGTLNTDKIAKILIDYMGVDMNRQVLAGILDACFAVYKIAGNSADPVQLTATAVEVLANVILQMKFNDSITFEVVEASPITDFSIGGTTQVKEGAQTQLSIENMTPTTGDQSDIVWESADPSIASVDSETGIVTGLDAGGSLGSLSTQTVDIIATSTTNNIVRKTTVTVTGKTGKYISGATINGADSVEVNGSEDYKYSIYPSRVAEGSNLYVTWGMVTGTDDDGNDVYTWADDDNPVSDSVGQIDSKGHYTSVSGGTTTLALKATTGYYLSDGSFYEISSKITTKEITTGIPVESINISVTGKVGSLGSLANRNTVTINGQDYEYVTIKAGAQYAGVGAAMSASVYPEDATDKDITWVIDNSSFEQKDLSDDTHTVSIARKAANESAAFVNIYAVSNDGSVKSNVITVCVAKNYATSNTISEDSFEIANGSTITASHTMTFDGSDGSYATCHKCNWYTSDDSVISINTLSNDNSDAQITGIDVGTATLYCVSADGGIVSTAEVTVKPDKSYLKEIIGLCDKTIVLQTDTNKSDYKKYMKQLDLAYVVYYEQDMASQTVCDTYAQELLTAFIKVGGYVGISRAQVLGTNKSTLNSDYVTVKVGSTTSYTKYSYDFDYSVYPSNAMYSKVEWSSSNSSISVDKNGVCKPTSNSPCSAVITCTVTDYTGNKVSASKTVAFVRTKATGVTLNTTTIDGGKIGDTQQLTATVSPTNILGKSTASCTDVTWYSTNPSVATVDSTGLVTFQYGGDCTIVCTTNDGGYTAECSLNVVTNYDKLQLLITQYTDLQLKEANYYPETWSAYNKALTNAQLLIARHNSSQEEVDEMYANLESAYNGLKKYVYIQKVELYLDGEPTSEFYQYDLRLLKEGVSYKNAKLNLMVRLYPNNASYASTTWESSTDLISVTSEGVCSPTSNKACYGQITCTVTDDFGNQFVDTVWVSFSYNPVTAVKLSDDSIVGNVGDTYQLVTSIEPTGTSYTHIGAADIQDYYFESDDESIATVTNDGLVTFVSAGSTTVRCISYDGGISAECTVSTEGDRTKLKSAVDEYKDIDYTNYEYSYAMAFVEAYDKAEAAITDYTLSQYQIDQLAQELTDAGTAMTAHPTTPVSAINIAYTTAKKNTIAGQYSDVSSGSVGSSDAVSINLASGSYTDNNSYNKITLSASAYPSTASYKTIEWSVDESYKMDATASSSTLTLTPSSNTDAYAIVTVKSTDYFGKTVSRTIYVVMADKTATSLTVNQSSLTMTPNDGQYQLTYSLNGSPTFSTIYFTSSDESVATVSSTGVITPIDKGSAYINIKTLDGGFAKSVVVTVNTDFSKLAELTNTCSKIISDVQGKYDYTEASIQALQEQVSAADTMIKEGEATQAQVNAQLEALNNAYNSLEKYVPATGLKIGLDDDTSGATVVNDGFIRYTGSVVSGRAVQLNAELTPSNSQYTSIEWTSSNEDITVDETGLVVNGKLTGAGVTKITCKITTAYGNEYEASAWVSFVRYGVTAVTFDSDVIYGAPQETKTITPNLNQSSQSSASCVNDCLYESSNTDVATVNDKGEVTFLTQGTAVITVTALDGGYVGTINATTTWDTTALQEAINQAKTYNYMDYAYDYGIAFNNAYNRAVEVYEDPTASQVAINAACTNLVEAMTNLEGHEFITPVAEFYANGEKLVAGKAYAVDSNNQVKINYTLNDGAMYKSVNITAVGTGITTSDTTNGIVLTKSITANTSVTVTTVVTDAYDRETTSTYIITVANKIINVTSVAITENDVEVGDTLVKTGFKTGYTDFSGIQLGYTLNPSSATTPAKVEWSSSAENRIVVDETGLVTLAPLAKGFSSNTADITCTVTNSDGTTVSKTVTVTIARK